MPALILFQVCAADRRILYVIGARAPLSPSTCAEIQKSIIQQLCAARALPVFPLLSLGSAQIHFSDLLIVGSHSKSRLLLLHACPVAVSRFCCGLPYMIGA